MACLAAGLAFGAVAVDKAVGDDWPERLGWSYSGGAEGASLVLGTVAGSMIAIAGTVFSMTLVAMSVASPQLVPACRAISCATRPIRWCWALSWLPLCIAARARTIRRAPTRWHSVPHLAVSLGVLLAMVSIGVLIYFIHHISVSIQADDVVARVTGN
ncbi:MAG: DUF2254 domain-containing protein [Betaproteobacteria bacterium]|uniref:DUF2254 domain-containing protein n=1 Tax=Candidatus Proximibacter danicus TaxID=2954365 RepID=A0A9D7K138_9PROT|nr:DUF2254 domain-containing protein [Candidatus Proximibacter danicus]